MNQRRALMNRKPRSFYGNSNAEKQGMGIILFHIFLEQIYDLCEKITILRNGELVGTYDVAKLPRVELIAKMIGKDLSALKDFDKSEEKVYLQ